MVEISPIVAKIGPPRKAGLPHPTNSIAVFLQIRLSFSHRPISQFTQALPGERKSVREAEIGAAFSARPKEGPKARFPKKSPFGPGPSGDKARKHRFGVKNGDYVKNSRILPLRMIFSSAPSIQNLPKRDGNDRLLSTARFLRQILGLEIRS